MSSARSSPSTTATRSKPCTRVTPKTRSLGPVAGPIDLSELHAALDRLRPQLCHCGLKGECLGCKGIEMVRIQAVSERLMSDPEIRRSAEQMQEKLMSDPETRQLLEELMRRLGGGAPPPEELN